MQSINRFRFGIFYRSFSTLILLGFSVHFCLLISPFIEAIKLQNFGTEYITLYNGLFNVNSITVELSSGK